MSRSEKVGEVCLSSTCSTPTVWSWSINGTAAMERGT